MKQIIVRHPPFPLLRRALVIAALFTAATLLQSCGTTTRESRPVTTGLAVSPSGKTVDALVAEADRASSPAKDNLLLQAAELLIAESGGQPGNRALALLFNIDASKLDDRNFAHYSLLYGRWTFSREQLDQAGELLANERLEKLLPELDTATAIELYQLRADYFLHNHNLLRVVEERMALIPLLMDDSAQEKNQALLWTALQQLSEDDQQELEKKSGDRQIAAWVELAHIANGLDLDLDTQVTLLNNWLEHFPHHPAAQHLPPELRSLQDAIKHRPEHVTLLVPLSGPLQKAGEAIRDGFVAAYYQAVNRHYPVPTVRVVDSQQGANFADTYADAAQDADLVIGPLEKEKVALLRARGSLPVPTLVLNDLGNDATKQSITSNLYQFGLNPEDEARQAAFEARQHHFGSALVIVPASDWGQRISSAFFEAWQQKPETPTTSDDASRIALGTVQFDASKQDYATVLERALGIEDSKNRQHWIRQWLNEKAEFEPRRRQDIDVIFLAARPEQARQIKPLLSFYAAGDVPVYATSSIYSGQPEPEKDADLNGVHLMVSPWMFANSELKDTIDQNLAPAPSLQSLYAMGADAWRLHSRLTLLSANDRSQLYGHTGMLRLDRNHRVYRQQLWATINKGKVSLTSDTP